MSKDMTDEQLNELDEQAKALSDLLNGITASERYHYTIGDLLASKLVDEFNARVMDLVTRYHLQPVDASLHALSEGLSFMFLAGYEFRHAGNVVEKCTCRDGEVREYEDIDTPEENGGTGAYL